ncbi:hypothetical protein DERP_014128 [Dermatophagoides pteronyssinus]|uniref:Uncharacterized protein n=1 Tax=Dermatophagoides pteronyssinus TaxID=6956 RepID=A0ABQ8IXB6_DERPT|nr:hypothetical protein DERP_014128 [Dermatophagoides pteronyssinus]
MKFSKYSINETIVTKLSIVSSLIKCNYGLYYKIEESFQSNSPNKIFIAKNYMPSSYIPQKQNKEDYNY